jgi:hypothetical protein
MDPSDAEYAELITVIAKESAEKCSTLETFRLL